MKQHIFDAKPYLTSPLYFCYLPETMKPGEHNVYICQGQYDCHRFCYERGNLSNFALSGPYPRVHARVECHYNDYKVRNMQA